MVETSALAVAVATTSYPIHELLGTITAAQLALELGFKIHSFFTTSPFITRASCFWYYV
jgi:hypothetical protein